uniref:Secreted protein n=1 Tax=Globodera pallida TaxID=36090 RepID=A0A183CGB2_GLOPA
MVELSPTLLFAGILFSVPLQFYLSARSTSDAQFYLHEFVQQLREVYGRYFSPIFGRSSVDENVEEESGQKTLREGGEDTIDESNLREKGESRDVFGVEFCLFLSKQIMYLYDDFV